MLYRIEYNENPDSILIHTPGDVLTSIEIPLLDSLEQFDEYVNELEAEEGYIITEGQEEEYEDGWHEEDDEDDEYEEWLMEISALASFVRDLFAVQGVGQIEVKYDELLIVKEEFFVWETLIPRILEVLLTHHDPDGKLEEVGSSIRHYTEAELDELLGGENPREDK